MRNKIFRRPHTFSGRGFSILFKKFCNETDLYFVSCMMTTLFCRLGIKLRGGKLKLVLLFSLLKLFGFHIIFQDFFASFLRTGPRMVTC